MNIYQYRFASFLKYLKENNAEVRIPETGIVYYSKNRKDKPSLKSLLIESLELTESQASELMSRKPVKSTVHSDRKSIYGIGKFIDAIHYYYDSDGSIISSANKHAEPNPFGIRTNMYIIDETVIKRGENLLYDFYSEGKPPMYGKWDRFAFPKEYEEFMQDFKSYVRLNGQIFQNFVHLGEPNYAFRREVQSLSRIYGSDILQFRKNESDPLTAKVSSFLNIIHDYSRSEKRDYSIFYAYVDGYLMSRKELCLRSFTKNISSDINWLKTINLNESELLKYRYELLWKLVDEGIPVSEWSLEYHALLIVSFFEIESLHDLIEVDLLSLLMSDVRFQVFSSENSTGMNYQEHDISLDELSLLLSKYNFQKGFLKSIEINAENILVERLVRYPVPEVVKTSTTYEVIQEYLFGTFYEYFYIKILRDLNFPVDDITLRYKK